MMTLAAYLESEGLTQGQFAERLGCSQSSVSKWLSGNPPKIATMRQIETATDGAVPPEIWLRASSEAA